MLEKLGYFFSIISLPEYSPNIPTRLTRAYRELYLRLQFAGNCSHCLRVLFSNTANLNSNFCPFYCYKQKNHEGKPQGIRNRWRLYQFG